MKPSPFPIHIPLGTKYVKILKALVPSTILATWSTHPNLLYLIIVTILGKLYKLRSFSLWSLLHFPFISYLDPNILTRILYSSLNVKDSVPILSKCWFSIVLNQIYLQFVSWEIIVLDFKRITRTWTRILTTSFRSLAWRSNIWAIQVQLTVQV